MKGCLSAALARAWHRQHDLRTALLATVGYVIQLPPWEEDADIHGRAAASALWRMGLKA
jgi:hypothetical protein